MRRTARPECTASSVSTATVTRRHRAPPGAVLPWLALKSSEPAMTHPGVQSGAGRRRDTFTSGLSPIWTLYATVRPPSSLALPKGSSPASRSDD